MVKTNVHIERKFSVSAGTSPIDNHYKQFLRHPYTNNILIFMAYILFFSKNETLLYSSQFHLIFLMTDH